MIAENILLQSKNIKTVLPDEIMSCLNDAKLRDSVYSKIPLKDVGSYHLLLKKLFVEENKYRNTENNDGEYFENIYHCAFFLYCIGDLEDVIPMWQVKQSNFDLGSGFDIQFLVGAGVNETKEYLRSIHSEVSKEAIEYIEACQDAEDFSNLNEWFEDKLDYFGILK